MAARRRIPALTILTGREQALTIGRPIQGVHAIGLALVGKDGCARLATLLSSRGNARYDGGEAGTQKQNGKHGGEGDRNIPPPTFCFCALVSRSVAYHAFVFSHGRSSFAFSMTALHQVPKSCIITAIQACLGSPPVL